MTPIRIAIHGAAGRMGRRLVAWPRPPAVKVTAPCRRPATPQLGQDAGSVAGAGPLATCRWPSECPRARTLSSIFRSPPPPRRSSRRAAGDGVRLVVCHDRPGAAAGRAAPRGRPRDPAALVPQHEPRGEPDHEALRLAGKALADKDADVEIIERHHRYKEDSPSGTALKFGEILAATMGHTRHRHGRFGRPGKRPHEEIGYHAIRVGDNPGEHTILFGMLGETIELSVRASNRDCYALGALAAAKFLAGKPPGLYGMADVLGF